jgi:NAD(P)-dependent dehydrogenase (short-subunit alcohol dehydrogenase family)
MRAVVCGATGALGRAVVAHFVGRGDRVVAVARGEQALARLEQRYSESVQGERIDLTHPADVEALWSRLDESGDKASWLVNVTGGYAYGSVTDGPPDALERMHELNLVTTWWSSRFAVTHLTGSSPGIVNLGAKAAVVGGRSSAAYAVAKAGVVRLTEVLADEIAERGVRANAVLPSIIDTEANRQEMTSRVMTKAVDPKDVAEVIGFLCSDAARAVTGASVPVYGLQKSAQ